MLSVVLSTVMPCSGLLDAVAPTVACVLGIATGLAATALVPALAVAGLEHAREWCERRPHRRAAATERSDQPYR